MMTGTSPSQGAAGQPVAVPGGRWPFVSVIVPVRNEAGFIRRGLDQVLSQNYDPEQFEVLVADGGSTDATCAIVRELQERHANLRLLDNPRRWSSAGRNVAVRSARGEVLVVVDGHCELGDRDHLRKLVASFQRSGAACIGRPQPLDVTGATTVQRAIAAARSSWLGHHPDSYIYSAAEQYVRPQSVAVAYYRWVFDKVGLFDESFDACEDVEFNHRVERAGLSCFFTPEVEVRYHPRSNLAGLFRQMVRYGRGRVRLFRKHPETFGLSCFLPALFLLGLAGGPLLAWLSPWLSVAYAGSVGVYGLTLLAASALLAVRERDIRLLPWLPLVFAAIHLGAGCGILQEWAFGAKKAETAQGTLSPVPF